MNPFINMAMMGPQVEASLNVAPNVQRSLVNNDGAEAQRRLLQAQALSRAQEANFGTGQFTFPGGLPFAAAAVQAGMARPQPQLPVAQPSPQPLMSTIGFGIDSSDTCAWDATEAAVRALRDAMERSTFRIPGGSRSPLQIHVKLGVPARPDSLDGTRAPEPMQVETRTVTSLLPQSIPVLPLNIVIGGLAIPGVSPNDPAICTAVACVTIQSLPEQATPVQTNPWTGLEQPTQQQQQQQPQAPRPQERTAPMELLALISARVRDGHAITSAEGGLAPAAVAADSPTTDDDGNSTQVSPDGKKGRKKLVAGVTAKNNVRHFVHHNYVDHSSEPIPHDNSLPLYGNKLQGHAFPAKLHEALTQIEGDGLSEIIGWMPHGRSFKIHKQQEFLSEVLPRYFIMTKKSSFLRQLNLYGFTRISTGPDKNSYYHELFLRGMRFLSYRISRTKVNGNGIRSAANPETEPNFYCMPVVPPGYAGLLPLLPSQQQHYPVSRDVSEEDSTAEKEEEEDLVEDEELGIKNPLASFPLKLQTMLDKLESDGQTEVISWQTHGRAFRVHDPDAFVRELMPVYFRQTKYPSFQRQLHLYNFQRITCGRDKGAYYHEKCLRGMPELCEEIKRTRVNGKGTRKPSNPMDEPDFYSMAFIPKIPKGSLVELPE